MAALEPGGTSWTLLLDAVRSTPVRCHKTWPTSPSDAPTPPLAALQQPVCVTPAPRPVPEHLFHEASARTEAKRVSELSFAVGHKWPNVTPHRSLSAVSAKLVLLSATSPTRSIP
jgi:hypothetical protein